MKSNEFYNSVEKDKRELGSLDIAKVNFILKNVSEKKVVLDIGCNDGYIGKLLIESNNKVYGCDIVDGNLKIASKRGLIVKKTDVENQELPFRKNFFDVVVLGDVIEHVFDTDELIIKAKNVLKKNGLLIITTPNIASLGRRLMLLAGISPFIEHSIRRSTNGFPSVGHIRYFTKSTLKDLLESNKLKVELIQGDYMTLPGLRLKFLGEKLPTLSTMLFAKARKR